MVQLASTNATFETTTFTVPTGSLTVNGGGGTDTIVTSANFAGDFNATLTINGTAATDIVTLNGLTLGTAGNTGNLSVLAHNINLNGDINTTAGTAGNVSFNGAVALAAVANPGATFAGSSLPHPRHWAAVSGHGQRG